MASNAPTLEEVSLVAGALGTTEFFVEKDWHVARILAALAEHHFDDTEIYFSGGTALSKAYGIIKRFSEDIDFRCALVIEHDSKGAARRARRQLYRDVQGVLRDAGYRPTDDPAIGNEHRFCQLHLAYPTILDGQPSDGLRANIRLEFSFQPLKLAVADRQVSSFVSAHRQSRCEVDAIACVDPVETGADKLSSLVWRLTATHLSTYSGYQPDLMRHLHDLAVLAPRLIDAPEFPSLVDSTIRSDRKRGLLSEYEPASILEVFLDAIRADPSLADDYRRFVDNYVYASADERINFPAARDAVVGLCRYVAG